MNTYEAVVILDERKLEDGGEAFSNQIAKRLEDLGGKVLKLEPMGRRQFARPIGKHNAGTYFDYLFELEPAQVSVFKETYRLDDVVLRLQVFHYDKKAAEAAAGA